MKANAHRGDVEIVCNYEIHGWGGGKKQVGEGNKEKKEQRKTERSEESALTEMFIIHSPIHLTLTLTQSSVEELSVTRECHEFFKVFFVLLSLRPNFRK